MRNRYPGRCYRCGKHVEAGAGHFERHKRRWRVQHAECAIEHRGTQHEHGRAECTAPLSASEGKVEQS